MISSSDMPHFSDDLTATLRNRKIIRKKKFLEKLYRDWYGIFIEKLPNLPEGKFLELGSGGGFLKELCSGVITSDILPLEHCDMALSAEALPFGDGELSAIFMIDVMHHIPRCEHFFHEAERTLKPGGMIIMIEPANTWMSRFFYKYLHHENWDPGAAEWTFPSEGPLSGANGALPWIVFHRDRERFTHTFPSLKLICTTLHTPFLYQLSGGMTRWPAAPSWSYGFFKKAEQRLNTLFKYIAMFETIELVKTGVNTS